MRRADVPADPADDASAGSRPVPVEHDDGRAGPALRLLAWATAVVLSIVLVRLLLVQSFVIPSTSMEPTLEVGDRVLVLRLPGVTGSFERGDVRRAKLYYLRSLRGKAAKIKEKRDAVPAR